ncbi:hypothetical protein FZC84_03670 [Rossellomorea vietnamensis]|uniref:Uncharacterized protein n=1 Tax=Rossellomorea vietnamensis TaxID=218284 RepID=A0A5D4MHZ7_9BACI|nr:MULTISPECIES: hypothetical protein [Bacillaceae]TYS00606.1 hypothetical protein FZC84_03670 [Rossellomorea vietnamensis]
MSPECVTDCTASPKSRIDAARPPRSHHRILKKQNRCPQNTTQTARNSPETGSMYTDRAAAYIES